MKKTTLLNIPVDHPAFAGHFPGMPIVPGVVLLDEAMHAIAGAVGHEGAWQIGSVKFLSPLGPGAQVVIEHEAQASGAIRFDIRDGERHIVSGSITPVTAS
jgi:3-hydroxyacyl-[acyl-carrier-protein] dehydratase